MIMASWRDRDELPRMSMVEAIRDAMDCKMAEDESVVVFGEDVGYFGGVFRCTEGLQREIRQVALLRRADRRSRHRRRRDRHGRLRPAPGASRSSSPTTSIPAYDQIVSEAARLRYRSGGEFTCADRRSACRCGGGIYRRPDPQPEPRGAVHPCLRA